jgi:acetyltransferase-like isoleucine patch superfamily enzyme
MISYKRIFFLLCWNLFARYLPGNCLKSKVGLIRSYVAVRCLRAHGEKNCVGVNVEFGHGGNITIGDRSGFGDYSIIKGGGEIRIGDDVIMGPGVMILSSSHKFSIENGRWLNENLHGNIVIGSNVFIGAGSIILAGVTIGSRCIIGAGSLINEPIPDGSFVYGSKTRVIKKM